MAILYRSSPDISSRFGRSLRDGTGREAAQPMVASDRVWADRWSAQSRYRHRDLDTAKAFWGLIPG